MTADFGLIQYIKGGDISVETEVSNIRSEKDVHIRIKQYFMNSPDHRKIQKEIDLKTQEVFREKKKDKRNHLKAQLDGLHEIEKQFKIDTLRLANTFSLIDVKSDVISKARRLFDQGKIKEADSILREVDLSSNQFDLILLTDFLEKATK